MNPDNLEAIIKINAKKNSILQASKLNTVS